MGQRAKNKSTAGMQRDPETWWLWVLEPGWHSAGEISLRNVHPHTHMEWKWYAKLSPVGQESYVSVHRPALELHAGS